MTQPGQTDVDVKAMQAAHLELDSTHQQISGQVRTFTDEINGLMSTWTGEAASAFAGAMANFQDDCNNILLALQKLSREVEDSANEYARTHGQTVDVANNFSRSVSANPGLPGF